jgi:DNA-binding CsgD family transcriptional regulator
VSADGDELDASCSDFERLGAVLLAAEAGAAASTAHRARGRNRAGRASAARARLLLSGCGGRVRTPGLLSLAAPALTPREREICALAADGLSSRSIATRLTLSVRTVDNHLQTAYGKLSVTGRRELAAVLRAS